MKGDCGARVFQEEKGQRWDYSTEALASPLDCFSLTLSVCIPAHTCTHVHPAGSRTGASPWTLLPDSPSEGQGKGGEREE